MKAVKLLKVLLTEIMTTPGNNEKSILLLTSVLGFISAHAQEKPISPVTFSGYIETYYAYDFGNPSDHNRPPFFYNYKRHNEANLNLGLIKAAYSKNDVRATLGLMAGTYPQFNMAGEQELLKNVYEANIGVKISKKHSLWVDAGVLPSHIGFESAVGKDCMVLTRSLSAENTPYFETGVKVGYSSSSEKWYLAVLYLNGWQRIQKTDGNQTPCFGTQVTYKPTSRATWNWSTYIGNDQPDSIRVWRYFNNFYGQFKVSAKTSILTGFDIGVQQKSRSSNGYNVWYNPTVIIQYKPIAKIQIAARGEYYSDKNGVVIATATPNGFQTIGYSASFDYLMADNIMFRIEARGLNSKDRIFLRNVEAVSRNVFMTASMAISL